MRREGRQGGVSAAPGFGLGLRPEHYEAILAGAPGVDWFEAISENHMVPGGKPLRVLERVRAERPVALHGVSLSIGGTDPLDMAYLGRLKDLARRIQPFAISDHLCWTGTAGLNLHDLLPLPYTEETLVHVAHRVRRVQDALGTRILLENVSSYVVFAGDEMAEWDFLAELACRADCLLLLDVNNVHVSAVNHGFDPQDFLAGLPPGRVAQFHLAGHSVAGAHLIDTHDRPVADAVWDLYGAAVRRFGALPVSIERDDRIPELGELVAELDRARRVSADALRGLAA